MTLLELLVKELPKRGGWPKGAVECFVHTGLEEHGCFYDEDGCGVTKWWVDTTSVKHIETRSDHIPGCAVTREQYETAIAAQDAVWNGEGLPPVGCECYASVDDGNTWLSWYTIAQDSGVVIFGYLDGDHRAFGKKDMPIFMPIRTEAERKREEFVAACILLDNSKDWKYSAEFFSGIYDEISSGKIPGVELTK